MEDSTFHGPNSITLEPCKILAILYPDSFMMQMLHGGGQELGTDLPSHTTRSGFETSILSSLQQDRANPLPFSRVGEGQLLALYGPHA